MSSLETPILESSPITLRIRFPTGGFPDIQEIQKSIVRSNLLLDESYLPSFIGEDGLLDNSDSIDPEQRILRNKPWTFFETGISIRTGWPMVAVLSAENGSMVSITSWVRTLITESASGHRLLNAQCFRQIFRPILEIYSTFPYVSLDYEESVGREHGDFLRREKRTLRIWELDTCRKNAPEIDSFLSPICLWSVIWEQPSLSLSEFKETVRSSLFPMIDQE